MMMLLPLASAFGRRGGDVKAVVARNNLPLEALSDPTLLIEATACYAAIEDMAETLGDPYFAAKVAVEAAEVGTPSLRTSARHAKTLGEFLARVVVEVATQADNVRYQLSATPEAASLQVTRMVNVSKPNTQVDAIGVVFYVSMIRKGLGSTFDCDRIIVTVPSTKGVPKDIVSGRALIESDINGLRISFPTEWLWAPFALNWNLGDTPRGEFHPDAAANEATLAYFRSVLKDNLGKRDFPLSRFAELCGLHPRRVQRVLAAQRTSYRQLKDEVRQAVIVELLTNSKVPIAHIATRVGLSGPSALDRAFKDRTGTTPTRFRDESGPGSDA
jgi:AraC-like DNA-binding protein